MSMKVECTKCGYSAEVPSKLQGEKIRCPKCLTEFIAGGDVGFTVVKHETPEQEVARLDLTKTKNWWRPGTSEYLVLTDRHLKGVFINRANGGKEELNTLLSGITSTTIVKGVGCGCLFLPFALLFTILAWISIGLAVPEEDAIWACLAVGFIAIIFSLVLFAKKLGWRSYGILFCVTGTVYNVQLRNNLPSTQKEAVEFIELLRKKKEEFERGI